MPMEDSRQCTVPVLMYHSVSSADERSKRVRTTNPDYTMTAEKFQRQVEIASRGKYRSIHLGDLAGGGGRKDSIVFTFDDGLDDASAHAFPALMDKEFAATFFVVTEFVGRKGYADWTKLREMADGGMSIQSHGVGHNPFSEMSDKDLRRELESSKKIIEDKLGTSVDFISSPHGMFDGRVRNAAQAAGYRGICTSNPGYTHSLGKTAVIKRINVPDTCTDTRFQGILERRQEAIRTHALSKAVKNMARSILGYGLYRKLYALRYRIE